MKTSRMKIKGRIEEVAAIGQFTIDSYQRDFADFQAYKPNKYDGGFMALLVAKRAAVDNIVNPVVLRGGVKLITRRINENVSGLRDTMNFLEGYVADAEGLTVRPKDFGIGQVRKKVRSRDVEGLNGALGVLLTNIGQNMTALTAIGYTAAMKSGLEMVKEAIFMDNAERHKMEQERSALALKNIGILNDFLGVIKEIWADGKRLYKMNDGVKLKDYTNSELIKRIRRDELHTVIAGQVTDKRGKRATGAKIIARPSREGKRGKTVKSNGKGFYELRGLRPVSYVITVVLKDGSIFVAEADARTNEEVRLDLKESL